MPASHRSVSTTRLTMAGLSTHVLDAAACGHVLSSKERAACSLRGHTTLRERERKMG